MKKRTLTTYHIAFGALLWGGLFELLSVTQFNSFQILNIVGFVTLALLPGMLTVLALRLATKLPLWGSLALMVGFSLLELMVVALLGNYLLPHLGVARPLDRPTLLGEFALLLGALAALYFRYGEEVSISVQKYLFFSTKLDAILSLTPIIFVLMSVGGAIRLNNGASNILTMLMLGGVGAYLLVLSYYARRVGEDTIPTALFFIGLALLFMTSLRGWYITGHDIQREYQVFELAKTAGLWNIATLRDPYNACLSITILPTVFTNLLHVADPYVYKFFYQILFAVCPVLVYMIGRQWTSRLVALLGTVFFIGFPTYFTDMPFLNRQEMAFIFFGLMLYLIFERGVALRARQLLFVAMGIGVILSHYSTTYTILIIFGLAVCMRPVFIPLFTFLHTRFCFVASSSLSHLASRGVQQKKITLGMIAVLFVGSYLWTSILTNTGSSAGGVLYQTYTQVINGFGSGSRAVDATSLVSFSKLDTNALFAAYIKNVVQPIRDQGAPGEYYPEAAYAKYPIRVLSDTSVSLTPLGLWLQRHGVSPTSLLWVMGQVFGKLSELCIPVGMLYLFFRKRVVDEVDEELYLIATACLVFVAMNIVLPVLSVQYGILRAIQQSMFAIAPIMAIGCVAMGSALFGLIRRTSFMVVFIVAFFFYTSSFIPQALGGYPAQIYLNNSGAYYDYFLIQTKEVYAIDWLSNYAKKDVAILGEIQFEVESDRFSSSKLSSVANLDSANDILPMIVRRNNFVFLSVANVAEQRASEFYSGDRLNYTYPVAFLDENKDLIYNNGGSRIYR